MYLPKPPTASAARPVPLAQAREQALANRRVARSGGDPRAASRRADGTPAFEEAAAKVIAIHGAAWKAGSGNAHRWQYTLRQYIYPRLGAKAVDEVTTVAVERTCGDGLRAGLRGVVRCCDACRGLENQLSSDRRSCLVFQLQPLGELRQP